MKYNSIGGDFMHVPKLRFRDFFDEWKLIDLSKVFTYYSTNSLSRDQLSDEGIIKNIHYGDIHRKFSTIVKVNEEVDTYIKDKNYNNKYELCKNGDLIFADASEDYDGIGKAIELKDINCDIVAGLHTIMARDNLNVFSPMFKGFYFNSPFVHNQLRTLANGFKVYGISKDSINNLKVYIPEKKEQEKIANTLELLDQKIKLQSSKISKLKFLKKGLLKKEFNNKNCNTKLINCFSYGKAGGTPKSTTKEYYNGDIPFLSISDMTSQGKYLLNAEKSITELGLNNSSAWLVPKKSIIISMYASYGLVSINEVDLSTSQAMFSMIIKEEYTMEYIYYYLYYLYITNYYDSLVSTGTQPNLNAEQIKNLDIYLPGIDEQLRIADKFNKIDRKLLLEENKLNKLIELKKGFMQSMFV